MIKTISTMTAIAFAASLAFAQGTPAPAKPQTAAPAAAAANADPIVIAAGSLTIRQSEFENALKTLPAEYQQYAMGPGKRQFAEDYLRMKMLAADGAKAGLDKDAEVVQQLNLMRENLIAQAQLKRIEEGITVSDEELRKSYDAHKAEYEQVSARHILVAFKGSPAAQPGKPELTEEQARAKAEEIRKQIVAGGNFEEIAKKESDDLGSGAQGGNVGAFGRGQMVPEFEKAAFDAKVGEVTPVVRTQFGYHVIKVDKHDMTPFETVKETLARTERQNRLNAQLDAMKTKANVTFNTAYFGEEPKAPPAPAPTPNQ